MAKPLKEEVTEPELEFKGHFMFKYFKRLFKRAVTFENQGVKVYDDVVLYSPYDEWEVVNAKNLGYYNKALAKAKVAFKRTLDEFSSV